MIRLYLKLKSIHVFIIGVSRLLDLLNVLVDDVMKGGIVVA